ncbi:UspA domain protein [Desulfarculus baarsii DSM 2075]|uniref:UspA domain protein n=1 Tax=Desulfarculus baarsii (strain ATCC 33931 / DSM 2075 / LMG 7858 / VKM B-1802 / 2st14) TaxID=644282 RepID=E1QF85_DESB2|nr:universal stress protein [Desulfarculus baarsii]ADK84221.1 UspA domain protein [Desulfarculus baarsii DSM 2075]
MDKKIIIAVDGSAECDRAVDYVGLMEGAMIKDLMVTLFFVMNPVPQFLRREAHKDPESYKRLKELQSRNRQQADAVLGQAKARLMRHGLPEERIETKALPRNADAARDILFEAEQGLYDALVLGRRGLSKAQEFFVGSVTNKIVQHAERVPVWIVGGRVHSLKILCAVDGSEGSLRAVDHMAFMLGGNPECQITLFHVGASLANYCSIDFDAPLDGELEGDIMKSDGECMADFYHRAVKVLEESGIAADQIETRTHENARSVTTAIVNEVKNGDYGTVVVGRRGENRSFFLGHVSDKVVAKCADVAVWVVG